ncbi:hypothetical protein H7F33_16925 [Pedobacter sp. PAMC26386]|nr:hypothetical protein H7F33_16925 [Pedobacter sp. PAMC26386]
MPDKKKGEQVKGPLHIMINPKIPGEYDASYGLLKLKKGGHFSVSIKEYKDAKDKKEKEETEARKFIDSKVLSTEAYQKLTPEQRATYDASIAVYNKGAAKRYSEAMALKDAFKNVCWAWQLAGKGMEGSIITLNEQMGMGIAGNIAVNGYRDFYFPELLEGGGMVWLEPFLQEDKPVGKIPNGCYVSAIGSPEIIDTIWTDTNNNPIEDTEVKFGSCLILHIYTKGLYGQGLDIQLIDRDIFSFNDELKLSEDEKGKKMFSFAKEVNVTKVLPFEVGKTGVSGTLLDPGQDVNNTTFKSTPFVQKCKVFVFIDPAWKSSAGGNLKIYPIVKSYERGTYFDKFKRRYLTVTEKGKDFQNPGFSGNNVVMVDEVETNIAAFHPCGYSVINVMNNERDYEAYVRDGKAFDDTFEVVAGTSFTQKVTIQLDDKASTSDCRFKEKTDLYHKGRVLEIHKYPEKGIAATGEQNKPSKLTIQSTTKITVGAVSQKSKHIIYLDDIKLKIDEKTDKKLVFQARFIYDTSFMPGDLPYIFRYFWVGKGGSTCEYVIDIDSCRLTRHRLKVLVYPDVRWSLRLDYKNMKSEYLKTSIEAISNQTYKDTKAASFKREPTKWTTPKQGRTFGVSLKAKFNNKPAGYQLNAEKTFSGVRNEGEEWDVTDEISAKLEKTITAIDQIGELIDAIFGGKKNKGDAGDQPSAENKAAVEKVKNDPKNKALNDLREDFDKNRKRLINTPKDSPDYADAVKSNQSFQRKMDKYTTALKIDVKRSVVGVEIYWPEFGLELDWSRVPVKNKGYEHKFNKTGVLLEGVAEAKPLVGIKAYLDFLALIQRAHPIALAIVAAADIAMALIGDGSKITLELSATMIIGGKVQGFLNTETGENTFNNADRQANSKALSEISGEIVVKVTASVKMAMCKRAIFIVVNVELELSLEAEAKFYVKTALDFDDKGIFISPELSFDGIQLKGKANIDGKVGDSKDTWGKVSSKNEFVYQAIDRQEPVKVGKTYFN